MAANTGFSRSGDPDDEAQQRIPIPASIRTPPVLELAEIIGDEAVTAIQSSGQLVFHAVGDTGNPKHSHLGDVVPVMVRDFHRPNPADHPAFFFHLGDVCYNQYAHNQVVPGSKRDMYPVQFYEPYANYPARIIAIPGNHDSNPQEDPQSIVAFQENFCIAINNQAEMDAVLNSAPRPPMHQPGVYYAVDAPYADIIALFSNGGETQGVIRGPDVGDAQWDFLLDRLNAIKTARGSPASKRKALIIAVHHPPLSLGGGHAGSARLMDDLNLAFQTCNIVPDLVLSGHAHCYQRFTENRADGIQLPYVVAGMGGHAITPVSTEVDGSALQTPRGAGDHSLRQYFNGYGHLLVTVTDRVLIVDMIGTYTENDNPTDSVTVDLSTRQITHETPAFGHPAVGEDETHHT